MIVLKPEYKNKRIGFNGSAKPLGERDDIEVLMRIAKDSNDKSLLRMFEEIPDVKEVRETVGQKFLYEFEDFGDEESF